MYTGSYGLMITFEVSVVIEKPLDEVFGPTPFLYRYSFKPSDKGTELSLKAEAEKEGLIEVLGTKARVAPEFVLRGFVKRGVEENFQTLKSLLESS